MAVHPPIVFGGYVFVLLAFALVLARMANKENGQEKLLRFSSYAAWLLLTVGIALGGLWAYEVLGWGGYWSWDPVETGSLLAWLALTAYFLLDPITKQGKGLAKEFMILVTFASLIFLSALTRGGLTQSIHAYALSPAGPILLFFALAMGTYFFYLKSKRRKSLIVLEINKSSVTSISNLLAFSSLVMIFLVSFSGVAAPIVQSIFASNIPTPSVDFYNNWNFPFLLIFVASLIGLTLPKRISMNVFVALIGGALLAGLMLSFLKTPTSNYLANAGLPILLLGFGVVSFRLLSMFIKKERSLHQLGKVLFIAGVFLTLFGVLISAGGKQTSQFSSLTSGSNINVMGTQIQFQNFTVYQGTGNIQFQDGLYPEKSSLKIDLTLNNSGTLYDSTIWVELYPGYGIFSKPTIIRTATEDMYLHIEETDSISNCLTNSLFNQSNPPEDFDFTFETLPFINILWSGVGMMAVGTSILLTAEFVTSKPKN
jgi:cytochrome c biogenesis factor